ncbi:MAG: transcriptional repressor [Syntrophales bacterium]|nr:transcriptional repressor [Syntrophales bacterium]MDD5642051.1 transcriptional repressor [Syntrophales bacterium]
MHRLRSRRIAVTPQRLAVLDALDSLPDHPNAETIYQAVRRQVPAISFNTVYKTLEVFCQKGLALKVNPLHEVARYDRVTREHAHLICRGCHRITDLEVQPPPLTYLSPEMLNGFLPEQQRLTIWGLCRDCQESKPIMEA